MASSCAIIIDHMVDHTSGARGRAVLRSRGCLLAERMMQYGSPLPRGEVMEGLIIDDYVAFWKRPLHLPPGRIANRVLCRSLLEGRLLGQY